MSSPVGRQWLTTGEGAMPRPERVLDPTHGPVQRFAEALRALRREAGNPVYRELAERSGYSTTTLSDAAGGRRLPALPVVLAYVRACGGDLDEWRERWEAAASELAGRTGAEEEPYRGLSSFQVEDADRFFGRERLVDELVRRLAGGRFLAVVGPSGSGKSSVLRAGLMAAVAREGVAGEPCRPVLITPEAASQAQLEGYLASPGRDGLLIVVDQFEEIFTLCADAVERHRFITRLVTAATTPDGKIRVVLGLRADFYGACADFPELLAVMAERTVLIGPMSNEELRRAVTKPAALAGMTVERALVTKVLGTPAASPGRCPWSRTPCWKRGVSARGRSSRWPATTPPGESAVRWPGPRSGCTAAWTRDSSRSRGRSWCA
jgi:hypothetical protein